MTNPIIAEVRRGPIVESLHRGAFAISDASGKLIAQAGDVLAAVYPRSAIKAFQAFPLLHSGAAARYDLTDEEIALCCSSHNGEAEHVRVASSILQKCGCGEDHYECGAHWPTDRNASNALLLTGQKPRQVHNNCSGKHAGMLALATHLGVKSEGYVKAEHAVQQEIAKAYGDFCDVKIAKAPMGIDGCSVPTWALPLHNVAMGFAKLTATPEGKRMCLAASAHPFMIAGSDRFDTKIMKAVPRLFIKVGAEGVFCGMIEHAGLGFALKSDDGAYRGAEVAIANALSDLDCWTSEETTALQNFSKESHQNWRKIPVGETLATSQS